MELDTEDLIVQNEGMGWSLPHGFLKYAEIQEKKAKSQLRLAYKVNTVLKEQSIESDCGKNQPTNIQERMAHKRLDSSIQSVVLEDDLCPSEAKKEKVAESTATLLIPSHNKLTKHGRENSKISMQSAPQLPKKDSKEVDNNQVDNSEHKNDLSPLSAMDESDALKRAETMRLHKLQEAQRKVKQMTEERQVMLSKMHQVWRKREAKEQLTQDLINQGAKANIAQSFVMSLDNDELQLYRSGNHKENTKQPPKNDEDRFTRKSSSHVHRRMSSTARMNSAKTFKRQSFVKKKSVKAIEPHEKQEKRLVSRLEMLFEKMDDFELRAQAYKLNRLELTKKAVNF